MGVSGRALGQMADEELMDLVADMDPEAFELVYDRHAQAAYSLCYRIAGSRALADDMCQETFLSIWRSAGRYDRRLGSVRSWILSIAHNRAIDQLRRATRHRSREVHDEAVAERIPSDETTDGEALSRVQAGETAQLLDRLPGEQRQVIELSFFSGYAHSEIAELLALPLGTVKGRMRLGLERLRLQMAGA